MIKSTFPPKQSLSSLHHSFCAFHIRSCCSFINIEIYQLPIGTKRHRILILPDVVFKIVVVFRLIEVANIDADTIATPGTRLFVPDGFNQALCSTIC